MRSTSKAEKIGIAVFVALIAIVALFGALLMREWNGAQDIGTTAMGMAGNPRYSYFASHYDTVHVSGLFSGRGKAGRYKGSMTGEWREFKYQAAYELTTGRLPGQAELIRRLNGAEGRQMESAYLLLLGVEKGLYNREEVLAALEKAARKELPYFPGWFGWIVHGDPSTPADIREWGAKPYEEIFGAAMKGGQTGS